MILDSLRFSLQLLLALAIPALIAVTVVAAVGGFLESLLKIDGSGLKYSLKLVLILGLIYLFASTTVHQVQSQLLYILQR